MTGQRSRGCASMCLPANADSSAPAAPASANRPISSWLKPYSGPLSRNETVVQNALNAPNPQAPMRPPPAQHRLGARDVQGLPELREVPRADLRRQVGHRAVEDERGRGHDDRGDRVDAAPAGDLGDDPGERPGQQDAGEQPGQHGADHPGALGLGGEGGRERDQHLDDHRCDAYHKGERAQDSQVGGRGAGGYGQRVDAEQDGEQPAAAGDVPGRDEQQQADAVTQLGERDQQRRARLRDVQAGRDRRQQRLRVVQVGYRGAGGEREEPRLASGQRARRRVLEFVHPDLTAAVMVHEGSIMPDEPGGIWRGLLRYGGCAGDTVARTAWIP